MKHLMVDIETLGTKSYSVITSIGAVEFNLETGEIGNHFYENIDIQSCLDVQLRIEAQSLMWWMGQSDEARKEIYLKNGKQLKETLELFNQFVAGKDYYMWGESNSFDLGLITNAMNRFKITPNWNYWNERDVRTLVHFAPQIKENEPFLGIGHHALDDCKHQIKFCTEIFNKLKK